MNERIKELIAQAREPLHNKNLPFNQGLTEYSEKFAELVVEECLKCGDLLVSHYIDAHPEQEQALLLAAIADYSSEIKKHFGVEE